MLQLEGIIKKYPGITANDRIDFYLAPGEIHALLGENGAGKTTLMKIAAGLMQPDSGTIRVKDRPVVFHRVRDAIRSRIGMVHQHFSLVDELMVAENIILGHEPSRFGPFLNNQKAIDDTRKLSMRYGLEVDPTALVGEISVGAKQRVEILKVLYREADILILDEPTAVLTPDEIFTFFNILKTLSQIGKSIIFITHKLKEAMQIAHNITVLRNGRVAGRLAAGDASEKNLVSLMVGREIDLSVEKPVSANGKVALEVQSLSVLNDRDTAAVDHVTFLLKQGEMLGIAGVHGNGQTELVQALTGLRRCISGKVLLFKEDVTDLEPSQLYRRGLSHIPEDRQKHGVISTFSIAENLMFNTIGIRPFSRWGILNISSIRDHAYEQIDRFDIRTSGVFNAANTLSGGNQQKLVVARELSRPIRLLIASQPTRGVDVAATDEIHRLIMEKRSQGCAILLFSTELDELFQLSDTIAVMYRGKLTAPVPVGDTSKQLVGFQMAGIEI
jgi:simple sugar transport system ATP-binding protein